MSPSGRYSNQIDHILVNERFAYNITDVRTYRGADCDSDHFLVASNLKVKLKTMSRKIRSKNVKYDVEKLKDNRKVKEFQENSQEMIREVNSIPETVDDQWKIIKDTLGKASQNVLGNAHKVNKPLFNTICQEALDRRKTSRERWLNNAENWEKERIVRVKKKKKLITLLDVKRESMFRL